MKEIQTQLKSDDDNKRLLVDEDKEEDTDTPIDLQSSEDDKIIYIHQSK